LLALVMILVLSVQMQSCPSCMYSIATFAANAAVQV